MFCIRHCVLKKSAQTTCTNACDFTYMHACRALRCYRARLCYSVAIVCAYTHTHTDTETHSRVLQCTLRCYRARLCYSCAIVCACTHIHIHTDADRHACVLQCTPRCYRARCCTNAWQRFHGDICMYVRMSSLAYTLMSQFACIDSHES